MTKVLTSTAILGAATLFALAPAPADACPACAAQSDDGSGNAGARMRTMFEAADADSNGGLSLEEFIASRESMREAVADGTTCSHGEAEDCDCAGRGGADRPADTDGDGTVSDEERVAHMSARFARIDVDGDGSVTMEELRAARRARRGLEQGAGGDGSGEGE